MTHSWEHWEGVALSGDCTLEQWLAGDDSAAFFRTTFAPNGRRAVVKLIPEAGVDAAVQLDLWRRTSQLRHPNLVELLEYGRADHDGITVLYAVFEYPEDTLASALSRSALNPAESHEVLDSIINALRYVHAQGLVIGVLGPEQIVAVGDQVKLSTDAIRQAGSDSGYSNDVRMLGDLWQQALMSASPKSAKIAAHAADPNPHARWTLAEISVALDPLRPTEPPPASAANHKPTLPPSQPRAHEREASHGLSKWIFVGAAAVLLVILALNRSRLADFTTSRAASPSAPVETSVPATAPAPEPAPKTVEPEPAAPAALKPVPDDSTEEMWRVIAFTYRNREAAAKKAEQLNQRHPDLAATVFLPNDDQGYYLVALGGRMNREEAARVLRSAREKGLPRDIYVQNYSR